MLGLQQKRHRLKTTAKKALSTLETHNKENIRGKKGKRKGKKKKRQQALLQRSNLYATISISSPDLAAKNPDKEQMTPTANVEDDNCPTWNHRFGMAEHSHILDDDGYNHEVDSFGEEQVTEEGKSFCAYEEFAFSLTF